VLECLRSTVARLGAAVVMGDTPFYGFSTPSVGSFGLSVDRLTASLVMG